MIRKVQERLQKVYYISQGFASYIVYNIPLNNQDDVPFYSQSVKEVS